MLQENGIKICIVSNSAHREKVIDIANKLEIQDYVYFAKSHFNQAF